VYYVIRVEDVESGVEWPVQRRYSEFYKLYQELLLHCPLISHLNFPRKRLAALKMIKSVIEERVVKLDHWLLSVYHALASNASMERRCEWMNVVLFFSSVVEVLGLD